MIKTAPALMLATFTALSPAKATAFGFEFDEMPGLTSKIPCPAADMVRMEAGLLRDIGAELEMEAKTIQSDVEQNHENLSSDTIKALGERIKLNREFAKIYERLATSVESTADNERELCELQSDRFL